MSQAATVDSPNQLTIEQLAAESGMTVRNIRSHQARGLLAPPEVRVRVGYYGPGHITQLRMIRDLQAQGFNLGGIKRLLDEQRFRGALAHIRDERPATLTVGELGRRFRIEPAQAPAILARAERLGVLVRAGDGVYEVPSPSLLAVAEEAVGRGIPAAAALDVFEAAERHCDAVAQAFVELFVAQVLGPFERAGMPAERWPALEQATERLAPLASGALVAIFERRLREQAEAAFGAVASRIGNGAGTRSGRPAHR